jgi:hypothetical protein
VSLTKKILMQALIFGPGAPGSARPECEHGTAPSVLVNRNLPILVSGGKREEVKAALKSINYFMKRS